MNIFYLDPNPNNAAYMHCDKHVVKMVSEYTQLLSTAKRVLDGKETTVLIKGRKYKRYVLADANLDSLLPKATHVNHPCNVWARGSSANYAWLHMLAVALNSTYSGVYGRVHAYSAAIEALLNPPANLPRGPFLEPPQAMPDTYKISGDSVAAYRKYYRGDKARFAKWKSRDIPRWFVTE